MTIRIWIKKGKGLEPFTYKTTSMKKAIEMFKKNNKEDIDRVERWDRNHWKAYIGIGTPTPNIKGLDYTKDNVYEAIGRPELKPEEA